MNIYHQLIENPLFFKWVYQPSPEIDTYWAHFLEQHPDDAKVISEFKAGFQKHLRYKQHVLSDGEKKELALKILKQIELKDKQSRKGRVVKLMMRYAAVAIVFLLIGAGLSHYFYNQAERFSELTAPVNPNLQIPTLILDDKEEIALNPGESNLQYSEKGEITVDNKQITKEEPREEVKTNTLVIPYGNRSNITLADGTKVWLNAGSRLIYPSRFVDREREVFLVGEAYFDVAKNAEQPFVVRTPDIEVEVLGTQFNISAYPEENVVQTVLTEGSIELGWTNSSIFDQRMKVVPGQLVVANKAEKETKVYTVNTNYYTSWKEGYLTFSNSDLNRVVKKLERYYNIHFRYEDPLDGMMKISGKLDVSNSKDEVFKYMSSLTGLNFTKINETYYMIN